MNTDKYSILDVDSSCCYKISKFNKFSATKIRYNKLNKMENYSTSCQSYPLILSRSCCECYRTSPQTNPTQRIKLTSRGRLSDQPGFEFKILIPLSLSLNVIASATSPQILLKQMHSFYQTDQPELVLHFKNPI